MKQTALFTLTKATVFHSKPHLTMESVSALSVMRLRCFSIYCLEIKAKMIMGKSLNHSC